MLTGILCLEIPPGSPTCQLRTTYPACPTHWPQIPAPPVQLFSLSRKLRVILEPLSPAPLCPSPRKLANTVCLLLPNCLLNPSLFQSAIGVPHTFLACLLHSPVCWMGGRDSGQLMHDLTTPLCTMAPQPCSPSVHAK